MTAEGEPPSLENLPPYEDSIVGSWRVVDARTPSSHFKDDENKQIAHFTESGELFGEFNYDGHRYGSRNCGYSLSKGFLVSSNRVGVRENDQWSYRNWDTLRDGNLFVLASTDRTTIWWFEKLPSPPSYACGFVNPQGDLEFIEPTEACGKLRIAWRKNPKT